MPPEVWHEGSAGPSGTNATFEADVFALGTQCYHLLVGREVPWIGAKPSSVEARLRAVDRYSLTANEKTLLHSMLAIKPESRHSLAALLDEDPYLVAAAELLEERTEMMQLGRFRHPHSVARGTLSRPNIEQRIRAEQQAQLDARTRPAAPPRRKSA